MLQPPATAQPDRRRTILKPVFYPAAGLILGIVLLTMAMPDRAGALFGALNGWIMQTVGWFYALSVTGFLVFCLVLATSRFGRIRLGPDHAKPDYGFVSWFAMLFSAGMGIGLMFFGVAEPLQHFANPPEGMGQTQQAAKLAMQVTFFHWGLHAWAIYAVVGLVLAYFGFRQRLPLTIRAALYPLIGERIHGPIGHAVDVFAVMGILFGVATSLGLGSAQINAGLGHLFGLPVSHTAQAVLIALITAVATLSVVSGLDRGIKRLSQLNLVLALGLLLFVVLAGPTLQIVNSFVENLGSYTQTVFQRSLLLKAYEDDPSWLGGWTIFYWGWWISWSPFVGMFIARISRGRTIREFLLGVLLVPSLLTFVWMTAFGNTALSMMLAGTAPGMTQAVADNVSLALFGFLDALPMSSIVAVVAIVLVATFFVTSSDSGSLVIDIITAGGRIETPVWQRVFWAVMEGLVAAGLLFAGGLAALQTAALASALPFTIVIIVALFGLAKSLTMEHYKTAGAELTPDLGWPGGPPAGWRTRLGAILAHPGKDRVDRFLDEHVRPALNEVADAIRSHDTAAEARVSDNGTELVVRHEGEADFRFAVQARGYLKPAFSVAEQDLDDVRRERFYRAEVYLMDGGQGYDIYGYSKDEIIHEVLNQYNKHLHFLHLVRA